MLTKKLALIDEQSSPLFRIMTLWNVNEPNRRKFTLNICAFHVSDGTIISVEHVLSQLPLPLVSVSDAIYQQEIQPHLNPVELNNFNNVYIHDPTTNKRYLNSTDDAKVLETVNALKRIGFDLSLHNLYGKNICTPFLVIQFQQNQFFNDATLTASFPGHLTFHELALNKYTFLVELDLIDFSIESDIAVYRVAASQANLIASLPTMGIQFNQVDSDATRVYCLQNSPSGSNLGRLLNDAKVIGLMDHHAGAINASGQQIIRQGLRYLIAGYFRFGSSGAPYLIYDSEDEEFKVFGIQSEAGGIQMDIAGKREGNIQWTNGIATPLFHIRDLLANIT